MYKRASQREALWKSRRRACELHDELDTDIEYNTVGSQGTQPDSRQYFGLVGCPVSRSDKFISPEKAIDRFALPALDFSRAKKTDVGHISPSNEYWVAVDFYQWLAPSHE